MGQRKQNTPRPRRIQLPIRMNGEVGLGDAISKMTSAIGIKPCGGCKERAKTLNRKYVLSGTNGSKS